MPRINAAKHLKEMGFSGPIERKKWLWQHKDEIVEYYKVYGESETRKHFHVGYIALTKLVEGTYIPARRKKKVEVKEKKVEFTFGDIISAAPNTAVLGQLMLDGITALINELREELSEAKGTITKLQGEKEELGRQLKNMTEDRERLMRDYNERILKGKVFEIDQTKHILVPKEKGR